MIYLPLDKVQEGKKKREGDPLLGNKWLQNPQKVNFPERTVIFC